MSAVYHILPPIAASGHPLISGSKNYRRTGDKIKKFSEKRVCGDDRWHILPRNAVLCSSVVKRAGFTTFWLLKPVAHCRLGPYYRNFRSMVYIWNRRRNPAKERRTRHFAASEEGNIIWWGYFLFAIAEETRQAQGRGWSGSTGLYAAVCARFFCALLRVNYWSGEVKEEVWLMFLAKWKEFYIGILCSPIRRWFNRHRGWGHLFLRRFKCRFSGDLCAKLIFYNNQICRFW